MAVDRCAVHTETPKALYIHIPFCHRKCLYCDFNTYTVEGQPVDDYLRALAMELGRLTEIYPPARLETIFVGGGTPTVLDPRQMEYFLQTIRRFFPDWSPRLEFTMEANPGTVDAEKLAVMKQGGVNRLSFGVQAFDNRLLQALGRIHDVDDVYRSVEEARKAGIANISIDLMFGLPGQTLTLLADSVDQALSLNLQHYSLYGLKVEENTPFFRLRQKGMLALPDEDEETEMYLYIIKRLREAGYVHYEISNFALPGCESRHNLTYWRNESYYAAGAGAHGYLYGTRYANIRPVRNYIDAVRQGLPWAEQIEVSRREAMEDFMMVGLRMLGGVKDEDFRRQFGCSVGDVFGREIAKLEKRGLLAVTPGGYRLTDQGLLLGNEVFGEFISCTP